MDTFHHARLRISSQDSGGDLVPIRSLISCVLAVHRLTRSLTPVSSLSLPAVWCEIRVFYKYITTFTRLSVPLSEERTQTSSAIIWSYFLQQAELAETILAEFHGLALSINFGHKYNRTTENSLSLMSRLLQSGKANETFPR